MKRAWSFITSLFRRSRLERDLEDELRGHIARRAEALERDGMPRDAALRNARIEFGTLENYKDQCRQARGLRWPDEIAQDLRYAVRIARRSPGVTAVAILSLALGIGANTAIFSILNSLLLTDLPVRDPEHLVLLETWRAQGRGAASYPLYLRLRDGMRGSVLQDLAATGTPGAATISMPGGERMNAVEENVSVNYFDLLGVRLIAGRGFGPAEQKIGSPTMAVLSEHFWRDKLGADPSIIGKNLILNDKPATVIGIAGASYQGIEIGKAADLWTNVTSLESSHMISDGWNFLTLVGRLAPNKTPPEVQASLNTLYNSYLNEQLSKLPAFKREREKAQAGRMEVASGAAGMSRLRERFALPLRVVMAVVALVLLIACANITNLLLARTAARQREIATRLSLGAGGSRLFRQFLTESLLLSLAGGALGLAVAVWTSSHLLDLVPQGAVPLVLDVHPNWRVLLFTSAVAISAGLLFGIVPALRVGRAQLSSTLKLSSASDFGNARGALRPGRLLSALQLALSTLLVFGAGLFVRTLVNLRNVDAGFHAEHVVKFDVEVPGSYTPAKKSAMVANVVERARALPGVTNASISWPGPFNGGQFTGSIKIPGASLPEDLLNDVDFMLIGPRFFSTMGAPLLSGRDFDARDTSPNHQVNTTRIDPHEVTVAIVNEAVARIYFGGRNPVGMKLMPFPQSKTPVTAEIVGLVRDIRHNGLRDQARPMIYLPISEMEPPWAPTFEIRLARDLTSVSRELERTVAQVDPQLRVTGIKTLDQLVNAYLEKERMLATIASLFGFIALFLAAVGLYGVMAYAVTRRTKEIGLRMALGAQRRQVLDMVLKDGVLIALGGVAIGVPSAFALSRLLTSLLFDVKPGDAGSLVTPAAVMLLVAVLAVFLPAWRATRVDPMTALRDE